MINFENVLFLSGASGATTKRTPAQRAADIFSVKDFGAVGDGIADDTAAIQACFDAAFGSWTSPHGGGANVYQNVPVYFPNGKYKVSPAISSRAITGAANNGSGLIRITTSTTGLSTNDNINIVGVTGTTEANGSWFVTVIDATHCDLQNSAFANAYVSGGTFTTPCLRLRMVQGGVIYGGGRLSTQIFSSTANAAVICTNAFAYSRVSGLQVTATTNGIAFQLDWMISDPGGTAALQSNTFEDCFFDTGAYGLKIGAGGNMGSETFIKNCFFANCTVAGLYTGNLNAVDNTMIGGDAQSCGVGILVQAGAVNTIHGVSFQGSTTADVYVINGANDCYSINGCRSESANFIKTGPSQGYHVSGCSQTSASSGFFFSGSGHATIDCCTSVNGFFDQNPYLIINNCDFQRADYLTAGSNENYTYLQVTPTRILTYNTTAYTPVSSDGGAKLVFTNASPIAVTISKNSDNTNRLNTGSFYYVQQGGAGKVTFAGATGVTITSRGSLKSLNGAGAVGKLFCDGSDAWTFEGDIVA